MLTSNFISMKTLLILLSLTLFISAQVRPAKPGTLLNKTNIVEVKELSDEKLIFNVEKNSSLYLSRRGANVLTNIVKGEKAELIAFDDRAYRVKIARSNGSVVGWVSPHALSCDDPNFIENFKKVHTRQISVKKLIAENEVAVGMTSEEVIASIGTPTKTSVRRTAEGTTGVYEYLERKSINHYRTQYDRSGRPFQVFSHTTEEIKNQITIEFTNNAISAIEETETLREPRRRTIFSPIYSNFSRFTLF